MNREQAALCRFSAPVQFHSLALCLAASLLAGACAGPTPEEKAAQDARDVAQVEAAQKLQPPLQPIAPEPIAAADIKRAEEIARPADAVSEISGEHHAVSDIGRHCTLRTERQPVFLFDRKRGLLKTGGDLTVLAADSGSTDIGGGLHAKYIGREHWAVLSPIAEGQMRITLRDRFDRVVYTATGMTDCTEAPAR